MTYCNTHRVLLVISVRGLVTTKPLYCIRNQGCWATYVVFVDASLIMISKRLLHFDTVGYGHILGELSSFGNPGRSSLDLKIISYYRVWHRDDHWRG